MTQTAEDICNLTLAYLGKQSDDRVMQLASPENGVEKTFAGIYLPTVRQEIRKYPYNCTKTTATLTQLSEVLTNTSKPNQYKLPNDYVAEWRSQESEWERQGERVVSAYTKTLHFPYRRMLGYDKAALIDPLLVEVIARAMQVKLSRPYTKQNVEWQTAKQEYEDAFAEAKRGNAMENGPINVDFRAEEGNWLTDRY